MAKPPEYRDDVSVKSDSSMGRFINYGSRDPDMSKETDRLKDEFQKELREARSKQRKAEEELRSFKQRIAENVSLSQAEDTEKMTSPVNKSRLQEMYHHLRVNKWPKITDRLRSERENPERIQRMIQNVFQEAVNNAYAVKKSLHTICAENMSEKEIPKKVQEHLRASIENLQLAIYHNKQAVTPPVVTAPEYCQEMVSECYRLGCLMALNSPPLQLDWVIPTQRMDRWDILPRDITHASESFQKPQTQLDVAFKRVEQDIVMQVQRLHGLVASESGEQNIHNPQSKEEQISRQAVLNLTLDILRRNDQEQLAEHLSSRMLQFHIMESKSTNHWDRSFAPESTDLVCCIKLKTHLQEKFVQVFEGVGKEESPHPLSQIYVELYITEGLASEVNQEHEVRHIESTFRRSADTPILLEVIFKQQRKSEKPIRTVLTLGVAGVGKTVLTQKFSLDWAEGRANQDIQLLFPFTFRELNVLRDTEYSLVGLLHHCFSQTKEVHSFEDLQVLFIFDGLDECRFPLDFKTKVLTEPTESASVEELLVNLIRGDLLPKARLWITTRPAAANQIPDNCVCMVTEVRGFSDLKKDEYIMKKISVEQQATDVISHIKSTRSLYIMSSIPIFCRILSTVLLHLMETTDKEQLPKTLTQMYVHFLVVQAKVKNIKYHGETGEDSPWTPETKEMVWSLGKLAFEQLQKGNLIFYESDLRECGLDAAEMARYSGVFTQVFREESGLYQDKVYCFIHLSVQEFLAALHVHQTFFSSRTNLLSKQYRTTWFDAAFYNSAVDQALQSPNGHLDLFLRFLLGLSLPTNQKLLKGLLTETGSSSQTNEKTIKYIKEKLNDKGVSAERSLNLLHCLNELNDHSLMEEIQKVMRGEGVYNKTMSPAQLSALSFLLLSSDSNLEEFDLRQYSPSEEALKSLMPVVKASNKAILSCCNLSERSCASMASVLSLSSLTHLDLSNNDLWDSGVKQLCEGLKSAPCRLKTLRLSGCLVSQSGGAALAAALSSGLCHLTELDLSYNHPGPSADLLTDQWAPHGPQQSLRLEPAGQKWLTPGLKKYFSELSLDPNTANRRLRLSNNNRTVTFMEEEQLYPDHQHRFDSSPQVLCSNAMTGHAYWEVVLDMDLGKNESVGIAMSYIGITSKEDGKNCEFGADKESWALNISRESYSVSHDGEEITLSYDPPFYRTADSSHNESFYRTRVAVYLDFTGGSLSFYEMTEGKKTLLYTYHTSFTQHLFAGFRVNSGSVSLVEK